MSKLLSLLEDYECAVRDSIDAANALGRIKYLEQFKPKEMCNNETFRGN